jgi:hypothetical protein
MPREQLLSNLLSKPSSANFYMGISCLQYALQIAGAHVDIQNGEVQLPLEILYLASTYCQWHAGINFYHFPEFMMSIISQP